MKYMLAVYGDSATWGTQLEDEAQAEQHAFAAFEREAGEAGVLIGNEALQPDAHMRSVREGEPEFADRALTGPELRLGCFYVLDCADVAEAKEWASKVPLVGDGGFHSIEIRPVMSS